MHFHFDHQGGQAGKKQTKDEQLDDIAELFVSACI
jgi:hypothetical protein